jgi:transposase
MQVFYLRYFCQDMHKKTIVVCVLMSEQDGTIQRFARTFGTMARDLLALSDWLNVHGLMHVAMESTGVLLRPVFNVLEEERMLLPFCA